MRHKSNIYFLVTHLNEYLDELQTCVYCIPYILTKNEIIHIIMSLSELFCMTDEERNRANQDFKNDMGMTDEQSVPMNRNVHVNIQLIRPSKDALEKTISVHHDNVK